MGANKDTLILVEESPTSIVSQSSGVLQKVFSLELTPIEQPKVDEHFARMGVFFYTLEVFRYLGFLLEYRLAPNGWLRAWTVSCLRLFLLIAIPLATLTWLSQIGVAAAANLAAISLHLDTAVRAAVAPLFGITAGAMAIRWLIRKFLG